jgi:hypothetical protein
MGEVRVKQKIDTLANVWLEEDRIVDELEIAFSCHSRQATDLAIDTQGKGLDQPSLGPEGEPPEAWEVWSRRSRKAKRLECVIAIRQILNVYEPHAEAVRESSNCFAIDAARWLQANKSACWQF